MREAAAPHSSPISRRRRGSTLVEFTLLGIPAIFLFTSVMAASVDMWQFFTLTYAVNQTARYTALHGLTCTLYGNTCTVSRATIATFFQSQAMALDPALITMVLNDGSGAITCNPVTSCPSSTSTFPSTGNNTPRSNTVTVQAKYTVRNPIFVFWPGSSGVASGAFIVGATSTQLVLF